MNKDKTSNTQLIPLSTLLTTVCYIDCGSNERLREVVGNWKVQPDIYQSTFGIDKDDTHIYISPDGYMTTEPLKTSTLPTHHITQINLDI